MSSSTFQRAENALTLADLSTAAPDIARGLQQLLDHEDRDEDSVFGLTFEISVPGDDGKPVTVPLKVRVLVWLERVCAVCAVCAVCVLSAFRSLATTHTHTHTHTKSLSPSHCAMQEDGHETPVTFFNKHDYVQRYVRHYLYGRCEPSFDAFKQGFLTVCQGTRCYARL